MLAANGVSMRVDLLMVGLIAVSVLYTCYGGMRSVIITDVFQFILLSLGLLAAIAYLNNLIPMEKAVEIIQTNKGDAGFDPLGNENFGPSYAVWMVLVAGVVSAAIWPTALTRALCIKREETVAPCLFDRVGHIPVAHDHSGISGRVGLLLFQRSRRAGER